MSAVKEGWPDAPSHVCRGGPPEALAFCCPPVKPCPIFHALDEADLDTEEYVRRKKEFAKKTPLGSGKNTCFGSLVWCCKITKPCPLRDSTLQRIGMSPEEYMWWKKKLSEYLLGKKDLEEILRETKESEPDDKTVEAVAEAAGVSEEEARRALEEADGDPVRAVKLLKSWGKGD
ncbi:methanogenesis marker 9 domain-containing protein [Methanopyrus sp.]